MWRALAAAAPAQTPAGAIEGTVLNSCWTFRTAGAQPLAVPNLGGAIAGARGVFGTDLNGDGGPGAGAPRAWAP
jgi:hypothetical protein